MKYRILEEPDGYYIVQIKRAWWLPWAAWGETIELDERCFLPFQYDTPREAFDQIEINMQRDGNPTSIEIVTR